jgi:hypothetical protein
MIAQVNNGGRDVEAGRRCGALLRVEQAETKRKTPSSLLSARSGTQAGLGRGAGLPRGLLLGYGGPIGKPLLSLIFFSVFFFSFNFSILNSFFIQI